jgi:hypothetical protein
MVVFLLFAVAVAAATGYQVVSSEFAMARQNRDSQEALAVARAGLQRYLGETVGVVGASVSYAIGNGIATVTARKVLEQDPLNHLYYILSEGRVDDPRTPLLPAKRSVATYAWHRVAPITQKAAFWMGGAVRPGDGFLVRGADDATATCYGSGTKGGVFAGGQIRSGGSISGSPATEGNVGFSTFYETVGVRWDVLTNPSFPVDYEGSYPNFSVLPADAYPVIRFSGDHQTPAWGVSGRGVLIVTGRLTIRSDFVWDGIVLAGAVARVRDWHYPYVRGMFIGGLNGSTAEVRFDSGDFRYDSCRAYAANRSLSYLEVVSGTLFEVNG